MPPSGWGEHGGITESDDTTADQEAEKVNNGDQLAFSSFPFDSSQSPSPWDSATHIRIEYKYEVLEDSWQELVHSCGSWEPAQVVRLGSRCRYVP
ncbi:hypothetical protein STEG23_025721, partial [Scotinomys teguina]